MWFLIISLSIISFHAEAKYIELTKNNRSIFIEEKSEWQLGKDLFGMPYIYFSPKENGQRSNISFTDTGADVELDIKGLAKSQDSYQNHKKKWADSIGAIPISFEPYTVSINERGHRIHRIGFNYSHENKVYNEGSYYIECRGKILYSKSLRLEKNEKHENDFKNLISSLDCGGV